MRNPIREFREQQGLTLDAMAALGGVTRLTVVRSEQGVFANVPSSMVRAILNKAVIITEAGDVLASEEEINDAYKHYQFDHRRENYGYLNENLPPFKGGVSPLLHWRLDSAQPSQIGFCAAFCVHPGSVDQVEKGRQRKLPTQLVDALLDSGYDQSLLEKLALRQDLYFRRVVNPDAAILSRV